MNKNIYLTVVLLIIISFNAYSQTFIIQARTMDSKDWGFINLKGDYILNPQYRKCYSFSEDGYAVIYERKIGYSFINTKGEKLQTEITNFRLKEVFGFGTQGFKNGFVPVLVKTGWGYMNTQGKIAVPAKYNKVSSFKNGFAIAQIKNDMDVIDNNGYASGQMNNIYIIDNKGNQKLVEVPGIKEIKWFSEDLAPFKNDDGLYGFIDTNGNVAIEARFLSVGYFNAGLAWAKTNVETIGYLNPDGEWVIQPQFFTVNDFDPETKLAKIKQNDQWVYLRTNGEIIRFDDSDYISEFHEGLAKGKKNEKLGFYNSKLEWVIEPQFDGVRNFKNGYAAVKIDDKWGIIDKAGNWVIQPVFAALKDVEKIK
ncbi:MAG: WG repeat-containing protein [Bacteroidales bacterium]|nr:WG repeat-containing protein [Bacteroidales bacterium]